MGENERWAESGGQLPNGLLPGAGSVMRSLDGEQWLRAEETTAELIERIQPNQQSEETRNAVADYVRQLIMKCFPCQVCKFGSVPLKTYLPDGDIDLTAFSHDQILKESWANQVRDILENVEKNENAEFHVKEVQYIQAEVKIVKCLVENIVVDISFNQVGGLCTLCFLDEVDNLINQNHLFKRSVILIKAWCYYESRILGAHHGLISTYALETLVLYIFHVYNNSFNGPLEVLYHFLDFFSNFDWDNFCVSLWGPVPISSLPAVTADPPRKDGGELLLSKMFLDACSSVYAVFPGGQESNGQPFISKHFNVIDPLRGNNNLGRSVSKGNFLRIRSAFAFGAKKLARLLDCHRENLISEVNNFFTNTWERYGGGLRPDVTGAELWHMRLSTSDNLHDFGNSNNMSGHNIAHDSYHEKEYKDTHSHGASSLHGRIPAKMMPWTSEQSAVSHIQNLKHQNLDNLQVANHLQVNKAEHLINDTDGRFLFVRTHSSPELSDAYGDALSQKQNNRQSETTNAHDNSARLDTSNRKKNHVSESLGSPINRSSFEDNSYVKHAPFQQTVDGTATDSNYSLDSNHQDLGLDALNGESLSTSGTQASIHEKQDIVNMMSSASLEGPDDQFHVPFNLNPVHLPFLIPPSFFSSMGYGQRNVLGFVPTNIPWINPSFPNVQFPLGLVSPQLTQYHGSGVNNPYDISSEQSNGNLDSMAMKLEGIDSDFWQDQDVCSSSGYDPENESFDADQSDDNKPPSLVPRSKYVPPPRASSSASLIKFQQKHTREKHGSVRHMSDSSHVHGDRSEVYADERSSHSKFSSAAHSNSFRSRTSSESSWDGSSGKTPKSTKEKRGKKIVPANLPTSHGKIKVPEHLPCEDDDDHELLSNMGTEIVERNGGSDPVASLQVPGHHVSGYEVAQTSETDSTMPFAPMLIGPGRGQRTDVSSGMIAFYPTGPPIPFLTMLPVYNVPPERGTSDSPRGHFAINESSKSSKSLQILSPADFDHSEDLNQSSSLRGITPTKTSDILNSDFTSHWQNLQFGRSCQDQWQHGPVLYPSPIMVPPNLHGPFPYDNSGRTISANGNISQVMTSYGHHFVPLTHFQSVSGRPLNAYHHYMDDMPRYRCGTGTYLPNPVSVRESHSSGTRRGNFNHDRNDNYGDGEGNWNSNSKSRSAGRNHNRTQNHKSNSRADRLATAGHRLYRHESIPSNQSQNGPLSSNSTLNGPQNEVYNMFPLGAHNLDSVSNEPLVPPVDILYPCDRNAPCEPLQFGSLGPADFRGVDDQQHLNNKGTRSRIFEDRKLHGSSGHQDALDQSSSSHHT